MKNKKIILVGAGIMSATLGVLLKKVMPDAEISIYERLENTGLESSEAMNNAGTGHSAFCELNYTPIDENGNINITKAIKIAKSFELSKEFWTTLILDQDLRLQTDFIHNIPHYSIVWGDENIDFLKQRFHAMQAHPLFAEMQYSDQPDLLAEWLPLMMQIPPSEKTACTRMDLGTDVNFGLLTQLLFRYLCHQPGVQLFLRHEVQNLEQNQDGNWHLTIQNLDSHEQEEAHCDFVFLGAGGGSLHLLEKSDIPEAAGYGGFPISGQWLVCHRPEIAALHHAKVYGKANVGAPPMSVPHLDTRIIDGEKKLLFGPFAGFSTKFLKQGSHWDLPQSIELDNIVPMLAVGYHNLDLVKYLVEQVSYTYEDRMAELRKFYPQARSEDWELMIAGQRVQVIKKDATLGGILQFGTELVASADGTIAALLGASPGASTSVTTMMDVLQKCFPDLYPTTAWQSVFQKLMPSHNLNLDDPATVANSRRYTQLLLDDPHTQLP